MPRAFRLFLLLSALASLVVPSTFADPILQPWERRTYMTEGEIPLYLEGFGEEREWPEFCVRDITYYPLCVGPFTTPGVEPLHGRVGVRVNWTWSWYNLTYDEQREVHHGPYRYQLPLIGEMPICNTGCIVTWPLELTAKGNYTVSVYAFDREANHTIHLDHNTTRMVCPPFRPEQFPWEPSKPCDPGPRDM